MESIQKPAVYRYFVLVTIVVFLLVSLSGCGKGKDGVKTARTYQEEISIESEFISSEAESRLRAYESSESNDAVQDTGFEGKSDSTDCESVTAQEGMSAEKIREDQAELERILSSMSLEEKVGQMFIVPPESLVKGSSVTKIDNSFRQSYERYPVGGINLSANNLQNKSQAKKMITELQKCFQEKYGLKGFVTVTEEGGSVIRVKRSRFQVPDIGNMSEIGADGDIEKAREAGETVGTYLHELGFNVDFAPVADVLTNSRNTVVKYRSFGSDPHLVSDMCAAFAEGLEKKGVIAVYKHFPGHGGTAADTHQGYAYVDSSLQDLKDTDLIPFQDGIANGISWIMVAHISLPNITGDDTPASLSKTIITDLLRKEMSFDGIVLTDGMTMDAITDNYNSGPAAVKAILAGTDIILAPDNFTNAYKAVLEAVRTGKITERRIDESVTRILRAKLNL